MNSLKVEINVTSSINPKHTLYTLTIRVITSITVLSFPAFAKQLLTDGSILDPPKAAISPNCLGNCMQSCSNKPSLRWSTKRFGSAIRRYRSRRKYDIKMTHLHVRENRLARKCLELDSGPNAYSATRQINMSTFVSTAINLQYRSERNALT